MEVVIDFETTGFRPGEDEILQVSIIDGEYNVLLNEYCKPLKKDSWEDAERVHGITPQIVENALPFENYKAAVLEILNKANYVIAYNTGFEEGFLRAYGIEISQKKWVDPMLIFAEIYGDYNEYYGNYKWQSLSKCANYYDYPFQAHDSLEDVKATLYCYKKMVKNEDSK